MRNKFQATDSRGTVHKRTSENRTYTHCVVVHIPARPKTTHFTAVNAHDRAEWAGSLTLAEKNASGWRRHADYTVEILTAERV